MEVLSIDLTRTDKVRERYTVSVMFRFNNITPSLTYIRHELDEIVSLYLGKGFKVDECIIAYSEDLSNGISVEYKVYK